MKKKSFTTVLSLCLFLTSAQSFDGENPENNNNHTPQKRKLEELDVDNGDNQSNLNKKIKIKKPKKRSKAEKILKSEQELNYPDPITWEDILKAIPKTLPKSILPDLEEYFSNIKNETEKEDYLKAFKKIYEKNKRFQGSSVRNNSKFLPLIKYFKKHYKEDKDLILMDIIHDIFQYSPVQSGTTTFLNNLMKAKKITKKRLLFAQNIVKNLIEKKEDVYRICDVLTHIFYVKNDETEADIERYIITEKAYDDRGESLLMKTDFSTKLYDLLLDLNENEKILFDQIYCKLKKNDQVIFRDILTAQGKKIGDFIINFSHFYGKFPHFFDFLSDYIKLRDLSFWEIKSNKSLWVDELSSFLFDLFPKLESYDDTQVNEMLKNLSQKLEKILITPASLLPKNLEKIFKNFSSISSKDPSFQKIPYLIFSNITQTISNTKSLYRFGRLLKNLFDALSDMQKNKKLNEYSKIQMNKACRYLMSLLDDKKYLEEDIKNIEIKLEGMRFINYQSDCIESFQNPLSVLLQFHFKQIFPHFSDEIIKYIQRDIYAGMKTFSENIRAALSSVIESLESISENIDRLTEREREIFQNSINYLVKFVERDDQGKFFDDEEILFNISDKNIYQELDGTRQQLNIIIARINNNQINYNDRQSVHNVKTHKEVDDLIQRLWEEFPLEEYGRERKDVTSFDKNMWNSKDPCQKIFSALRLIVPKSDFQKFETLLFKINVIVDSESDSDRKVFLKDFSSEIKERMLFIDFLMNYKQKFDNNPDISNDKKKHTSFREILNMASVYLKEKRIIHPNISPLSLDSIQRVENFFYSYQAKVMIWNMIRREASQLLTQNQSVHNIFSQPKRGNYDFGMLALFLRVVTKIYDTSSNNNEDLNDKMLTLRNSLAISSFEYGIGQPACCYGQTYNMLEQFLNIPNENNTIQVNVGNFLPIILQLIQPEVEALKKTSETLEQKLDRLKGFIVSSLSNPSVYSQDFWPIVDQPLKQIDDLVNGLREHFEDDEEMAESAKAPDDL